MTDDSGEGDPPSGPRWAYPTDSSGRDTGSVPASRPDPGAGGRRPTRRRAHPAHTARLAAALASVGATAAVATAMAGADRAPTGESVASDAGAFPETSTTGDPLPGEPISSDGGSDGSASGAVATTAAPNAGRYTDGVYLGSAEDTKWGDVQVEVTVSGGRLVDIVAVQIPDDRKSSSINRVAVPRLEAAAMALQDADLDVVSGATYTSRTYAASLQAALDRAAEGNEGTG